MEKLLFLQLIASTFLCGLIWVIQLVHYPTYRFVQENNFKDFQKFHQRWITVVVGPMMLVELGIALALLSYGNNPWFWLNLSSVLLIWAFTFCVSVPRHNQLTEARQTEVIESLIWTNWPRTILWTLRSWGLMWLFFSQSLS